MKPVISKRRSRLGAVVCGLWLSVPFWVQLGPQIVSAEVPEPTCFDQEAFNNVLKYNRFVFEEFGFFERTGLLLFERFKLHACPGVEKGVSESLPDREREPAVWEYSIALKNYIDYKLSSTELESYYAWARTIDRHQIYASLESMIIRLRFPQGGGVNFPNEDAGDIPSGEINPLLDCRDWSDSQFIAVHPRHFDHPVDSCVKTTDFMSTRPPFNSSVRPHRGADFDTPNPHTEPFVYTPLPSCVVDVHKNAALGNHVLLTTKISAERLESMTYGGERINLNGEVFVTLLIAHLKDENIMAQIGDFISVPKDNPLGLIGSTGVAAGTHVHVEIRPGRIQTIEEWNLNQRDIFDASVVMRHCPNVDI